LWAPNPRGRHLRSSDARGVLLPWFFNFLGGFTPGSAELYCVPNCCIPVLLLRSFTEVFPNLKPLRDLGGKLPSQLFRPSIGVLSLPPPDLVARVGCPLFRTHVSQNPKHCALHNVRSTAFDPTGCTRAVSLCREPGPFFFFLTPCAICYYLFLFLIASLRELLRIFYFLLPFFTFVSIEIGQFCRRFWFSFLLKQRRLLSTLFYGVLLSILLFPSGDPL